LSLVGFFCAASFYTSDQTHFTWIIQNENLLGYLATNKGFINTNAFFLKNPNIHDVKNHINAITLLAKYHYTEAPLSTGDSQLRDTLCQYILNDQYVFREHEVIESITQISKTSGEKFVGNFVKSLFNKVKELAQNPPNYNREEAPHK
jgi:hypothetical protein